MRAPETLSDFISALESAGELVRIREKVSPLLEITEITDRVCKTPGGGKALLFENVEDSSMPVLINAFGSDNRMKIAFGSSPREIAAKIEKLVKTAPPETLGDKLKLLGTLLDIRKTQPKKISGSAPCQEVVMTGADVDLNKIPVLKCWPNDAGRFVTFPLVFTKSLDGRRNVGMYRLQIFDKNTTGMHWHIHKDGAHNFHDYKKAGKRMPVAVAIGTDPATTYSATAPLPRGVDELMLSGFIRNKPVRIVKCKTIDMWVPADAEIILEGYVDPAEPFRIEGPFGDHTGYYSLADYYPLFHVTAVTTRKNPVYFTTIVGKPPMEDCYMGRATADIFLPLLQMVNPEITGMDLPWEGVFHNCVVVSMEKQYPYAAHRLMNALWGAGQMSFAKMILAVDSGVDVRDHGAVFRNLLNNFDVAEDLFYSKGVLDVLDHSSPDAMRGSKLGLDATSRGSAEKARNRPQLIPVDEQVIRRGCEAADLKSFSVPEKNTANRVIIFSVDKQNGGKSAVEKLMDADVGQMANIAVIVDASIKAGEHSTVAWKLFNNTDPLRDIVKTKWGLLLDATKKTPADGHDREWPDDIEMDKTTRERVDALWPKLGVAG
ncbi:MAG: menaquinone biosynthesis decarboxylase [Nitrospinae bacterium]|nr:menaquinone biosynthesis decarboxylase [Nitrospinota bacterium]